MKTDRDLCGTPAETWAYQQTDSMIVDCPVCGRFVIGRMARTILATGSWAELKQPVSWRVREAADSGEMLVLTRENFETVARDAVRASDAVLDGEICCL